MTEKNMAMSELNIDELHPLKKLAGADQTFYGTPSLNPIRCKIDKVQAAEVAPLFHLINSVLPKLLLRALESVLRRSMKKTTARI